MNNYWLRRGLIVLIAFASTMTVLAEKKQSGEQVVDAGSFGIFVGGRRVATESFTIKQLPDGSVTSSEVKVEDGSKVSQSSQLELTPTGDLRRYQWKELAPGKSSALVEPQDQFLVEKVTVDGKTSERPFLVPPSSMVLDDYFFSHREILAWRYLGASCKPDPTSKGCDLPKSQFGVIVPRQQSSSMIGIEFAGREKMILRGKEVELSRFNLSSEGEQWVLWLDSQHKLQRIVIAADNTEVVRD